MLEIKPRAARGLGEYTPDNALLTRLNAFDANTTKESQADRYRQEVLDWGSYLMLLQNKFVPMLQRYQSHPVLGAEARTLLPLVQSEIARGGALLSSAGTSLRAYGGSPAYGYTAGVGVRAL